MKVNLIFNRKYWNKLQYANIIIFNNNNRHYRNIGITIKHIWTTSTMVAKCHESKHSALFILLYGLFITSTAQASFSDNRYNQLGEITFRKFYLRIHFFLFYFLIFFSTSPCLVYLLTHCFSRLSSLSSTYISWSLEASQNTNIMPSFIIFTLSSLVAPFVRCTITDL